MRLPFFRSKDAAAEPATVPKRPRGAAPAAPPPDAAGVAAARTQARRRLVGALLLLAVGVIGFPLLFETQPRPLPQDTPLIVPEGTPPRPAPVTAAPATRPLPVVPADAGVEAVAAASQVPSRPASSAVTSPAARPVATVPSAPAAPAVVAAPPRAAASAPVAGRWVVQVGAFNDAERLKAARAKLQKLGYASYTQDVDSPTGRRTRVRVGPFKTRAEAEAVALRAKSTGLQVAVLSL